MKRYNKIFWIFVIIVSIVIAYGSLVRPEAVPGAKAAGGTEILHFASYLVLSLFYFNALKNKKAVYSASFAISYGILLEVLQYFTGYRTFSLWDISINSVGAIMASVSMKGIEYGAKKLAER
ncbi:MAG: VanZ family protein [archaeon]